MQVRPRRDKEVKVKSTLKLNDTSYGSFLYAVCSDCGDKGCSFSHWGILLPKGKIGKFCHFCWDNRLEKRKHGEIRLALGIQPPGIPEIFHGCCLWVLTEDKMLYQLRPVNGGKNEVFIVSVNRKESNYEIRARVMRLQIGERFVFRIREDKDNGLFYTFPVAMIKPC
ncbi:MAG TPA: hypothetical protein VMW82_01335 [Candidatus Paceibacterota bacterium]|nr:hypothetical protein [Candidatus Paceibacterota bacterium]